MTRFRRRRTVEQRQLSSEQQLAKERREKRTGGVEWLAHGVSCPLRLGGRIGRRQTLE